MFAWRTRAGGIVEIDQGLGYAAPVLAPNDAHIPHVLKWRDALGKAARHYQIPPSWVAGVIYAESGGDASAVADDGGRGLMQIMPTTAAGYNVSTDALLDPLVNIDLGTRILRDDRALGPPWDLVHVASMYNAGHKNGAPHPSQSSPFGFRETPGHILRVVTANNTFASLLHIKSSRLLPFLIVGVAGAMLWKGRTL